MAWTRLDDGLHQNPKLARLSDSAFRLWVHSLTFVAAQSTDGDIPGTSLALIWPDCCPRKRRRAVHALVKAGSWVVTSDGWRIHDYLEYNPSQDEMEERALIKGQAGSYGNHIRWHVKRGKVDPQCEWCRTSDRGCDASATRTCDRKRSPTPPHPSKNPPQDTAPPASPTEQPQSVSTPVAPLPTSHSGKPERAAAIAAEFESEFWPGVPHKTGKGAARKSYATARKKASKDEILKGLPGFVLYEAHRAERPDYTPLLPSTWLNQERWADEIGGVDDNSKPKLVADCPGIPFLHGREPFQDEENPDDGLLYVLTRDWAWNRRRSDGSFPSKGWEKVKTREVSA